jgi:hypothetical protein
MRDGRNPVGATALMLAAFVACSAYAGTPWRNDWFAPSPQTLDTHEVAGFGAKPTQAVTMMSHCVPVSGCVRALSVASMLPRMARPTLKVFPES